MIAFVEGEVVEKTLESLIINASGVGYELLCPVSTLDQVNVGETLKINTYHHIRENAQELYGFSSSSAKDLFEKLLSVNGVGPKAGLAIMSLGDDQQIRSAIASEDVAFINSASGVGKKGAEKVVLELKDKVGSVVTSTPDGKVVSADADDATEALVALGYPKAQAVQALAKVDRSLETEERIKLALKEI